MPIYKENEYIECEDYCILRVSSKKYGKFDFLIDKHNIEKCKMYHWNISKYYGKSSGDYFYAITSFGSWGCMFNGHSIENTNSSCDDFLCQFCECNPCSCGDEDIED